MDYFVDKIASKIKVMKKHPNVTETFAAYIRRLRIKNNIGQRELANKIEVAPTYLNDVEKICLELAETHQDDRGNWIKNPLETRRDSERLIPKIDTSLPHGKTINEVIESYCGALSNYHI